MEQLVTDMKQYVPVSVGGGIAHDTTKGLATLLGEGGSIHDRRVILEPSDKIITPSLSDYRVAIIAVPTTMGASGLSRGAGFADKDLRRKVSVVDRATISKSILIDCEALATPPF